MNFEFSKKSKLYGRTVFTPVDRFSYVPVSEEGLTEYILAFKDKVPTAKDEPELYQGSEVEDDAGDEVSLRYPGLDEMVVLLTIEADERFRTENPELVAKNEMFRIDV